MISNLTDALDELQRHGLVGAIQAGWLMAGTKITERADIRLVENAFAICGRNGHWVLRTDGPGQTVTEIEVEHLSAAVAEALRWVQALSNQS